jgi:anti-repressor protein
MNELQTFEHDQFGKLPVVVIKDKEYFGANEVAESLEYAKPYKAVSDHCDSDGVLTWGVTDRLGRKQQKKFITVGNISRLIVAASKQNRNPKIRDKAKKYEKWIFDEVIPSIHKHGAYMTPQKIEEAL